MHDPSATTIVSPPWLALRQSTRLSQREVERRLGWDKIRGHGRLSLIERGISPTSEEARQLREFYGRLLSDGLR